MTTETTITLNPSDEATAQQLAMWKRIDLDAARAHVALVRGVIAEVARGYGYHPRIVVGPDTWGQTREQLVATGIAKARKGNGRRGATALRAKYGERVANDIIEKARAAR